VPSHLYSYSYAQRRDWPRLCSPQPEILRYIGDVAREHGVDRCFVPNPEVASCTWDEAACRWDLTAADGRAWQAEAIVIATGQLHRPSVPRIAGSETFTGHAFHSAEWDHGYDLRGKRVGVVGTGASSVQFVPEVADRVEHLAVFQRSAY
jgi:cation diffusion facilitator CzcD-associated flavoprotein CzcO